MSIADSADARPNLDALAQLVSRDQIRELVASYTHLGDGGRLDAMVQLFADDAVLEGADARYAGHVEIRGFFDGIVGSRTEATRRTFVRHHIANVTITLHSADTASGASYWTVYSDDGFESSGRYRDEYTRGADGRWRFQVRKIGRDRSRL